MGGSDDENEPSALEKMQECILSIMEELKSERKAREDMMEQLKNSERPAVQRSLFGNEGSDNSSSNDGDEREWAQRRSQVEATDKKKAQEAERRRKLVARFLNKSCSFDGSIEPVEFLEKFKYIAQCEDMSDEDKKKVLPALLEGTAANWFEQHIGFNSFSTWDEVLEKFEANFQLYSSRIQAGFELDKLRRKSGQTIVEFVREFEKLCLISKGPRTNETDPFWTTELYRKLPVYLREKIFLKQKTTYNKLKEKVFIVGSASDEIHAEKMKRNWYSEDRNQDEDKMAENIREEFRHQFHQLNLK